ncbi:MAG: ankyrin repeat domain-containing protein [Firmicutes bacterium]|nr:ankyrin repeat domain-containing protein [Bacillota bacterium]
MLKSAKKISTVALSLICFLMFTTRSFAQPPKKETKKQVVSNECCHLNIIDEYVNLFECEYSEKHISSCIKNLIDRGADVNVVDENLYNLLMLSIINSNYEVAKLLISKTKINSRDKDGRTALHWAVDNSSLEIVEKLIEAGADVNAVDDKGTTLLDVAIPKGKAKIIEKLIKAGAHVSKENINEINKRRHLLRSAIVLDCDALVKLFIDSGNIHFKDKYENTCLHWASYKGQIETIEKLVEAGVSVHEKNMVGNTVLDCFQMYNREHEYSKKHPKKYKEIIKLLLLGKGEKDFSLSKKENKELSQSIKLLLLKKRRTELLQSLEKKELVKEENYSLLKYFFAYFLSFFKF